MRSKFRNSQEENYSKRTAGEQRVNVSRERVNAGYNLAGAGLKKQSHADLYFEKTNVFISAIFLARKFSSRKTEIVKCWLTLHFKSIENSKKKFLLFFLCAF